MWRGRPRPRFEERYAGINSRRQGKYVRHYADWKDWIPVSDMPIPVDWNKLKTYRADKRRSFEELCFQIAYANYSSEGTFVPIDDSGGGSGVEFYLFRPNGAVWGWQAKFHPHGRFNSGRRAKVKSSLKQSLEDHKRLEKWFLCSPTDFTTKGNNPE